MYSFFTVKGSNPFSSLNIRRKICFSVEYVPVYHIISEKNILFFKKNNINKFFITFTKKRHFYSTIKMSFFLSKFGFLIVPHISYLVNNLFFVRYCLLLKSNKINNIFILKGDDGKICKKSFTKILFCLNFFNIYSSIYPDFYKKTINYKFEILRIFKKKKIGVNKFVTQISLNLISLSLIDKVFKIKKKNIYIGLFICSNIDELFLFFKRCGIHFPFFLNKNKNSGIVFFINLNIIYFLSFLGFKKFHLYFSNFNYLSFFIDSFKNE